MSENIKITKYFKYLLDNKTAFQKQFAEFEREIDSLLKKRSTELGTVLKCHLVIEYYLDKYLETAYPTIVNWEKIRLTFSQKIEMINYKKAVISTFYKPLKNLNSIRNKFSHDINYRIKQEDYTEILAKLKLWDKNNNVKNMKILDLIKVFTVRICTYMNVTTNGINKNTKELGLPGYLIWLEEMGMESYQ